MLAGPTHSVHNPVSSEEAFVILTGVEEMTRDIELYAEMADEIAFELRQRPDQAESLQARQSLIAARKSLSEAYLRCCAAVDDLRDLKSRVEAREGK